MYKTTTYHVSCFYGIDRWMPAKLMDRLTAKLMDHLTANLMNRLTSKLVDRLTANSWWLKLSYKIYSL